MPPLQDPEILKKIRERLELRHIEREIIWKDVPRQWINQHLDGATIREMNDRLFEFVQAGGTIKHVVETRGFEEPAHFDFVIDVDDRAVYIETVLDEHPSRDPILVVVSAHWP